MHYPVMTEKDVADRWQQVSLKTLRRWRLDGEGSDWHKLFRYVRYHEADVLEFERPAEPQEPAKRWCELVREQVEHGTEPASAFCVR